MTKLSGNFQVAIPTSFIIRAVAEGRISFHSLPGKKHSTTQKARAYAGGRQKERSPQGGNSAERKGGESSLCNSGLGIRGNACLRAVLRSLFQKHNFNPLPPAKATANDVLIVVGLNP